MSVEHGSLNQEESTERLAERDVGSNPTPRTTRRCSRISDSSSLVSINQQEKSCVAFWLSDVNVLWDGLHLPNI